MASSSKMRQDAIYPLCRRAVGAEAWQAAAGSSRGPLRGERLASMLEEQAARGLVPGYVPDLARLEWARHLVSTSKGKIHGDADRFEVNPCLEVLRLSWKIASHMDEEGRRLQGKPEKGQEWVLVWRDPGSGKTVVRAASGEELLALKLVVEDIPPEEAATGKTLVRAVRAALERSANKGLLIAPRSRLRRDVTMFPLGGRTPDEYVTAETFTLQWHLTQACDLRCRHCYDRSPRSPLKAQDAERILDDLESFCAERHVRGHVCFSGGNPFLYRRFFDVYRAAAERGFSTSVLGNPVSRSQLDRLLSIQAPGYYQVSLEGLEEHNDWIRGSGHFRRVMDFLDLLRDVRVSSAVMLTLTNQNLHEVIPLAGLLRDRTDHFTFNRLSLAGEGARLHLPTPEQYAAFLEAYVDAAQTNPILGYKDNLINTVLHRRGLELFDGCTGFGCGAAFNFLALLPDGEAHACRKFPSPLGNVLEQGIAAVYGSELAARYRQGAAACRGCSLRPVCGGCLSISKSLGLDIFKERDPFCFLRSP